MKRFLQLLDSVEDKLGDLLSPMLVKELRQGMRSKVFVASFLLIQALMFFSVIISLLQRTSPGDSWGWDTGFFWMMIAIPVLFIMPVRGYNTLASEIKGRTLELVFLTKLSPWRIVTGKWAALFAQTFLIICAVLPYIVVRYYLGGVDLFMDLQTALVMFLLSGLFTALTVGLSAYASRLLKALHMVGVIVGIWMMIWVVAAMASGPARFSYDLAFYAGFLVYGTIFLLLMLEMGASRIAPPAENHAFRKRLIGLALCMSMVVFSRYKIAEPVAVVSMIVLALICMGGLCEEPRMIPTIYQPFARRGFLGRLAGKFFYPGWPSALVYLAFIAAGCLSTVASYSWLDERGWVLFISFVGGAIAPVAFMKLIFPQRPINVIFYLVVQSVLCIITPVICAVDVMFKLNLKLFLSIFPTSVFLLAMSNAMDEYGGLFFGATLGVTILCLIILAVRSAPLWREIRRLEDRSVELGKLEEADQTDHSTNADAPAA